MLGKQSRVMFMTGHHTIGKILDYVHYDVWEPTRELSLGGSQYFVTFTDDSFRKFWVSYLK